MAGLVDSLSLSPVSYSLASLCLSISPPLLCSSVIDLLANVSFVYLSVCFGNRVWFLSDVVWVAFLS